MDDLFSHMAGRDYRQDRQMQELKYELEGVAIDTDTRLRAIRAVVTRVEQLELMNRALIDLLLNKGVVSEDELSVMVQQIDLLDGVEDGVMSASVHAAAPTCSACGRYANPSRSHCVYCQTQLKLSPNKAAAPARMVNCVSCAKSVPESSTYYSDSGVVCGGCFA